MKHHSLLLRSLPLLLSQCVLISSAWASGADGFMENTFTPEYHVPQQELPAYAAGKFAVEPASYWRIYHYLAYRALTGHALSKSELDLLNIEGWTVGGANHGMDTLNDPDKNGLSIWLGARRAAGAADTRLDVTTDAQDYVQILNCHRDAFNKAAQTLQQRYKDLGKKWGGVWLANQDAVFANCSPDLSTPAGSRPKQERPLTLPAALPPGAPDILAKDRAYQNASALFYAGRYDSARAAYLDIAKDAKSPWQPWGQYLAARCLLRKASLLNAPAGSKEVNTLLTTARTELQSLPGEQARSLITWVDARLRPDERRQELSEFLSKTKVDASTALPLMDYLLLLDKVEGLPMVRAKDPMTAWIGAMQAATYAEPATAGKKGRIETRKAALDAARTNWKKGREVQWLVAIAANALPDELTQQEQKAAAEVADSSPAYGQLQYHLARIALGRKKFEDAQDIAKSMLGRPLQMSVRNHWLRIQMAGAKTADGFFATAPRKPVDDGSGGPIPNEGKDAAAASAFDDDLASHLTRQFSLNELLRYRSKVPATEQKWVSEMIWTRAVILARYDIADAVTDELMKGRETTHHLYKLFKKAATPEQRKSAALLILANTPELHPYVRSGKSNEYGGAEYWSCGFPQPPVDDFGLVAPPFLAQDQVDQARSEIEQLKKLPRRSAYLIPQVMDWARQNKTDQEAPKALHFLVAATRNECSAGADEKEDKARARNYSKEAFQFLHAQYPKSEWTVSTKYYY